MISVSIVSHGHSEMVTNLVYKLFNFSIVNQIILTFNIPEQIILPFNPKLIIIYNEFPVGFGANHNAAFKLCNQPYFCVLNPDLEFIEDPFHILINHIEIGSLSLVAPIIINPQGHIEDSARKFPSLLFNASNFVVIMLI
jgi:hypothetical protein